MKTERKAWTYKGMTVYPASRNSSGIRWHTLAPILRADTKQGMRQLINQRLAEERT